MKTTAIIILAAALTAGCAAPVFRDASGAQAPAQVMTDCEYDVAKATAGIRSAVELGFMTATLTSQCLAARGYRRAAK